MTGCQCFYCTHERSDEHYKHERPFDMQILRDLYHPRNDAEYLAIHARIEYDAMTPDERAKVDARWAAHSEQDRDDIRAAVEFDLI